MRTAHKSREEREKGMAGLIVLSYQTDGTTVLLFEERGGRYGVHGGTLPSGSLYEHMAKPGG